MSLWDVYGVAHSLAVPTIRFTWSSAASLPAVLQGHPEGYDRDVIRCSAMGELAEAIGARARAIRLPRVIVDSREEGREYFERRRSVQGSEAPPS
jgi:hypothetical protein